MIKIGLLSIHSAHNYGSVLQAYALQNVLSTYCDKVEIIDYRPDYLQSQYKLFSIKSYEKYKGINKIKIFLYRILFFYPRYKKYKRFNDFMKNNYNLTKGIYKSYNDLYSKELNNYNILVCGSDQIWNTDITNGFDKSYYLAFSNKNQKIISYAASLGRNDIDTNYINDYKKYLNRFSKISVREESSVNKFNKLGFLDINVVLDPTLLINEKKWIELSEKSRLKLKKEYILVYRLEDTNAFNEIVNYISKKTNLPIISLNKIKCYKNEKNIPDAGPEDFLKLIMNAHYVITNSFHGTVFSVLFKKSNFIVPNTTKPARMVDLLKSIGLADRIILNKNEITEAMLYKRIEYNSVFDHLNAYRKESYEFLEEALNG